MATETWVINEFPNPAGSVAINENVRFESNGVSYEAILIDKEPAFSSGGGIFYIYDLPYGKTQVYDGEEEASWNNQAYRTITLDEPVTGNFLTWLQANAVKQSTAHGTSKILIDGVGIDLTADTVAANKMLSGIKAHDANGDVVTGNIPSKAAQTYTPGTSNQTIDAGQYLGGAQTIQGDANLVAANIASGKTIFGVAGTHAGQKSEQSKTLTLGANAPTTVTPDSGKVLSSVPVVLDTSVIKAENIAKDVQMLGITGTHAGGAETVTVTLSFGSFGTLGISWYTMQDGTFTHSPTQTVQKGYILTVQKNTVICFHPFREFNISISGGYFIDMVNISLLTSIHITTSTPCFILASDNAVITPTAS